MKRTQNTNVRAFTTALLANLQRKESQCIRTTSCTEFFFVFFFPAAKVVASGGEQS